MRAVIAAGLAVAMQVGALCAPLLHAHLDHNDGDQHRTSHIHAHVSAHAARHHHDDGTDAARRIRAADSDTDDITRLQVFVAVTAAPATEPAQPAARFALAPAPASLARTALDVVRSHGPPDRRPDQSRAPPARSVLI